MSIWNDIHKTIRYARRNGVHDTWYAAAERLRERHGTPYGYTAPEAQTLERQRSAYRMCREDGSDLPLVSILVPVYEPNETYFRQMIDSVLAQTFGNWELILADGSADNSARAAAASFEDDRVRYLPLHRNGGISGNTNAAAEAAEGSYVAFLDNDDLLTPDAVFEVTRRITATGAEILYSDEDKCDAAARRFFEPNRKPDFNIDYFLANNYICHFLVMKTELFKALLLRPEYDGAQDYDLMLRAPWSGIQHIGRVLYHWRTHPGSTAGDPGHKNYAHEAGRRALEEYFRTCHIDATVTNSRHGGFYTVEYHPDIFTARSEVGVVGGKLVSRREHRIVGGMMDENGHVAYLGAHEMESGPMHRMDTRQDCDAVDVRCMLIRDELRPLYQTVFGAPYETHVMRRGEDDLKALSLEFCREVRKLGYLIVWDPGMVNRTDL